MLVISRAQIEAFEAHARESFHDRLAVYVREVLPDHTTHLSSQDLKRLIVQAEGTAGGHGVHTQRGIAKWVCVALIAGVTFHEIPEVRMMFSKAPQDAERCLEMLFDSLCSVAERSA